MENHERKTRNGKSGSGKTKNSATYGMLFSWGYFAFVGHLGFLLLIWDETVNR